ncbi:MAG: hypothetical protein JOZ69_08815 [Myxococcales bacterium]|nr:hypothetical protein [Myxococcales bacterium]
MVDVRYRNPAWVTNQVMASNVERGLWSARFQMSTDEGLEQVLVDLRDAGARRAAVDDPAARIVVIEFEPVLVRRIAGVALRHGGTLVELASTPAHRDPS